ncbi:MAG: hypothetical protein KDI63_01910 [Gammaproteobacteria bacterium]|nr:hypothetical protein [Gammaproteobacteria bacterium]
MGNTIWFITILQEKPWVGFLIGLVFLGLMFGSKNLIVYFYSKNQERKKALSGSTKSPGETDIPEDPHFH